MWPPDLGHGDRGSPLARCVKVRAVHCRTCALAIVVLGASAACSSEGTAPEAAPSSVPAEGDGGTAPPPIDPSLFDCTSVGRPSDRAPPATIACVRDPKCAGRFVAAHRGAGGELGVLAPEDSLAAYRAAIALGVELVETDPRPTTDGVIVNVHDTSVDRTTDGTGEVSAMTLAAIQALHLRADRYAGDFSCERVPTLEAILATAKGHAIVLVDANKTDRVDLLVAAIQKTDTVDWAIFDTSDTGKIDRALAIEPRLMIQPRVSDAAQIAPLLSKYASHPPVLIEIDQKLFPTGASEIHAAGLRVFTDVFVADLGVRTRGGDAARGDYLRAYEKGADAIQTDLPHEALRALGRSY